MKLKPGKTYWAKNGRPLYCNGEVVQSIHRDRVGMYRVADLTTYKTYYMSRKGVCDIDDRFSVATVLHPMMAVEIVVGGHLHP